MNISRLLLLTSVSAFCSVANAREWAPITPDAFHGGFQLPKPLPFNEVIDFSRMALESWIQLTPGTIVSLDPHYQDSLHAISMWLSVTSHPIDSSSQEELQALRLDCYRPTIRYYYHYQW